MVGRVRVEFNTLVGEHVIQKRQITADQDTEERGNKHGCLHIPGRIFGLLHGFFGTFAVTEEEQVGKSQTCNQKGPSCNQGQQKTGKIEMLLEACGNDHRFGHEPGEEGEGRNGDPADNCIDHGLGHLLVETAQLGEFVLAGHMDDGTGTHEEQALVEDMGKGMGAGTVDGKGAADADAGDHIAHLADNFPAQELADIILHGGIDDAVYGHDDSKYNKDLQACTAPDQGVDGGLGRKGAHEDGAGDGSLAVGIGQPGVQRRHGGVQHQADHDQVGVELGVMDIKQAKGEISRGLIPEHKTQQ